MIRNNSYLKMKYMNAHSTVSAISSTCILMLLLTSIYGCGGLKESEVKYIGDWEYCMKLKDWEEPMISYAENTVFSLKENGTWSYQKGEGNWGSEDSEPTWGWWDKDYKNFSLNFRDVEVIISNHADQMKGFNGSIVIIEGVELLRLAVDYTYAGWEHYVNKYGKYDSYNTTETGTVNYFYVRKGTPEDVKEKVKSHFNDKERQFWGGRWFMKTGFFGPIEWIKDNVNDSYFEKEIGGLEYNFEHDTADTKQKILLSAIYLFKQKPDKAMEVINRINPTERQDSVSMSSLSFIARNFNGLDSIDFKESHYWDFYFINEFMNLLLRSGNTTAERVISIQSIEDSVKVLRAR
jgi:hypothetical protein